MRDDGAIPSSRRYPCTKPCGAKHFGLCKTRDKAIYADSLLMAGNIEKAFCQGDLGQFFMFEYGCGVTRPRLLGPIWCIRVSAERVPQIIICTPLVLST